MDIKQKMALAAAENINETYGEIVKSIINAAWTDFNHDDRRTWPPLIEGKYYLVEFENYHEPWAVLGWHKPTKNDNWWWGILGEFVIRYAVINDLLYIQGDK